VVRFVSARLGLALGRSAIVAGISLIAGAAAAQSSVDVPENCGSQAEFAAELVRLLGAEASKLSSYALRIAPAEHGEGHVLHLTLRGEQRELRDRDCRTLFKSAVVVAAASVRPDLIRDPSADEQAPEPEAAAEPAPPPRAAPVSTPSPPWRGRLGAGGGAIVGLVPAVAPVIELSGLVERSQWGALLSLRHATLTESEAQAGRGVEVRAFGGRAGVTYHPVEFGRLSLGVEADFMVGRGTGVTTPLSDTAWSLAPSLELAAIPLQIEGLRLELAVQGRVALLRPRFQVEGVGDVYRVPQFGAAGLLRVAYLLF
jgi:hypothetical protein